MEVYDRILQSYLSTSYTVYGIVIGIFLLIMLIAFFLREKIDFKKIRNICLGVVALITVLELCFTVPRIIDLKSKDYIVLENVTMTVVTPNQYDGSMLELGEGYVIDQDANSITVKGIAMIDLPDTDDKPSHTYEGTVIYAKRSKQILEFNGHLIEE